MQITKNTVASPCVGHRIKAARRARKWSQAQLAQRMFMISERYRPHASTVESFKSRISKWERGESTPSLYNRSILALALKVPAEDFGMTGDPQSVLAAARRRQRPGNRRR